MDDEGSTRNYITTGFGILVVIAALSVFVSLLYSLVQTKRIDAAKTERLMEERVPGQTGLPIARVDCPDDVKIEKGKTFDCVARLTGGRRTTIQATQVNDDGDLGLRIKPGTIPLDATKLEQSLKQRLEEENKVSTRSIECPDNRFQKAGETLSCVAVDTNDQRGTLDVRITNDNGDYTYVIRQG